MCAGRDPAHPSAPRGEGEAGWLPVPLRRVAIRRRGTRTGECGGRGISHLVLATVASAGYSGAALQAKLGFAPGTVAALVDAPGHLDALLGDLDGVTVRRSLRGRADL